MSLSDELTGSIITFSAPLDRFTNTERPDSISTICYTRVWLILKHIMALEKCLVEHILVPYMHLTGFSHKTCLPSLTNLLKAGWHWLVSYPGYSQLHSWEIGRTEDLSSYCFSAIYTCFSPFINCF